MPETEQAPTRPRPATSDVVGTLILCGVGAAATVMGLDYGFMEDGQAGPGFLPVLTGAFILLASLLELARMFLARPLPTGGSFMETVEHVEDDAHAAIEEPHTDDRPADASSEGPGDDGLDTFGRTHSQRSSAIVQIFAIMLIALLLIPVLGLLLSMSLMTLTMFTLVERKRWLPAVLATAGAFAFFYVFFDLVLGIPLPTGMLGIV